MQILVKFGLIRIALEIFFVVNVALLVEANNYFERHREVFALSLPYPCMFDLALRQTCRFYVSAFLAFMFYSLELQEGILYKAK